MASDFKAKIPSVSFEDPETSTCFQLTVGNSQAHETTELLALYNKIDPRVRHLAIAFRFWAKVRHIERHNFWVLLKISGISDPYSTVLSLAFRFRFLSDRKMTIVHCKAVMVSCCH